MTWTPHELFAIRRAPFAVVLAAAVAASSCRSTGAGPTASTAPAPAPAPTPPVSAEQSEQAAIERARADSVRYPYTEADVHFMTAMIGHHSQAIVMSGWAPTHGASRSVQILAERIINAQQDEIVSMQQWLRDRRQPVPEAKAGPMKMMMGGMEHEMLMPGMLTDEQMKQLDAARGPAFDRLFLTFMIQHHKGATSMVQELFNTYGAAQDETVFKFANDVNVDQTTEIARMEQMLALAKLGWTAP
jgi:uncharacterized protein (DUF305 family)